MKVGAIVLAAGEGRRLAPLTSTRPKPMLPVLDVLLVDRILGQLAELGPDRVCVGLGHLADVLERHLRTANVPNLVTRVERHLTGPAGALRQFCDDVADLDVVVVTSGDVLFDEPLHALVDTHLKSGAALTFATTRVQKARRYGVIDVDPTGRVLRTREKPDVPDVEYHLVSCGIYAVRPSVLAGIPEGTVYDFASQLAPDLIQARERVQVHELIGYWSDIGQPAAYRDAVLDAATGHIRGCHPNHPGDGQHVSVTAVVDPSARLYGSVVGDGVRVGAGCQIVDSVLLPGAEVPASTYLFGALVGGGFG